jgi:predicted membrane protein
MNKQKIIKYIKIINITILGGVGFVLFNIFGYVIFLTLQSPICRFFVFGYCVALIFAILSFKKDIFLRLSLFGWLIILMSLYFDIKTPYHEKNSQEKRELCLELRAEPSCVENECAFICSNFHGEEYIGTASVCEDKDMSLCSHISF